MAVWCQSLFVSSSVNQGLNLYHIEYVYSTSDYTTHAARGAFVYFSIKLVLFSLFKIFLMLRLAALSVKVELNFKCWPGLLNLSFKNHNKYISYGSEAVNADVSNSQLTARWPRRLLSATMIVGSILFPSRGIIHNFYELRDL